MPNDIFNVISQKESELKIDFKVYRRFVAKKSIVKFHQIRINSQSAKKKVTLEEWAFVELAFKMKFCV